MSDLDTEGIVEVVEALVKEKTLVITKDSYLKLIEKAYFDGAANQKTSKNLKILIKF